MAIAGARFVFQLLLCAALARSQECVDLDNAITDAIDETCDDYTHWLRCYDGYDDSDFSAMLLCCVCGGGDWAPTPAPTPSPPACVDTDFEVSDENGVKCNMYVEYPLLCKGGHDDADFTANDMCCACHDPAAVQTCSLLHRDYLDSDARDSRFVCRDGSEDILETGDLQMMCGDAFVTEAPDLRRDGRTNLDISIVLMELDDIDEASGTLTVRPDIQLWWRDCRWARLLEVLAIYGNPADPTSAMDENACPSFDHVEASIDSMQGFLPDFNSKALRVLRQFRALYPQCHGGHLNGDAMWHPFPLFLLPSNGDTSASSSSRTHGGHGPLFQALASEAGSFTATILDSSKVEFSLKLSYDAFPFDSQHVELLLPFDDRVNAKLLSQLQDLSERINQRSHSKYVASSLSPHVSESLISSFSAKGWLVKRVDARVTRRSDVDCIAFELEMDRLWDAYVVTLFGPLLLLTVVPTVGFMLPASQVLPRVAVAFTSFLMLGVLRSTAYSMIPEQYSSLMWLDTIFVAMTELMWFGVAHNIFALYCFARKSRLASRFLDSQGVFWVPSCSVVIVLSLIVAGVLQTDPISALWMSQALVALPTISLFVRGLAFLSSLDEHLLGVLSAEMTDNDAWSRSTRLDAHELHRIFNHIDKTYGDGSGFIIAEEILKALKSHGMQPSKGLETEQENAFTNFFNQCARETEFSFDKEMGIDEFTKHCQDVIARSHMRKIRKKTARAARLTASNEPEQMAMMDDTQRTSDDDRKAQKPEHITVDWSLDDRSLQLGRSDG